MKRLSEYSKDYYEFSGKASDVARQLAFAGIALVWIFRIEDGAAPSIPQQLLLPTALLALTLAFDLLQYITATSIWGIFQWRKDRKRYKYNPDPKLEAPYWYPRPQFIFFVLKLCSILIAFILLTRYFWVTWYKASS